LAQIEAHLKESIENDDSSDMLYMLGNSAFRALNRKLKNSINTDLVYAAAYLDPSVFKLMPDICNNTSTWKMDEV
jgi:hypothetical protein